LILTTIAVGSHLLGVLKNRS